MADLNTTEGMRHHIGALVARYSETANVWGRRAEDIPVGVYQSLRMQGVASDVATTRSMLISENLEAVVATFKQLVEQLNDVSGALRAADQLVDEARAAAKTSTGFRVDA